MTDYLLIGIALAALAYWLWRRNMRQLDKTRDRWDDFGKGRRGER